MNEYSLKQTIEFRHTLHRHPELSMHESGTMERIKDFLTAHTSLQIVQRDGWLYAVKPGNGKRLDGIAFRADMDALPMNEGIPLEYASCREGISHKCGHDGHCAALCGLAMELEYLECDRPVYLIFQPGEEIGAGAVRCTALLEEQNISEIYAFHNLSGYPEGAIVYRRGLTQPASEGLSISLMGRQSHASAPEEGRNPASVIANIVLFSKELLRKRHAGMVLCTVTGVRVGNGDFGISAGDGEVQLTLRAEHEAEMKRMEEEILSFAASQAAKEELSLTYTISDYFPETRNHDSCIEKIIHRASQRGLTVQEMKELWRASEDFGHYLKACPGAIVYIGNGVDYPALHTREYDFNDRVISRVVDLFVRLVD